jgi:TM2 domain-containing membrane protein YozV
MSINITKNEEEYTYYFTEEGKQFGPFNLVQLISKINGETMVWRDGIDWTNANKLEELQKFFPDFHSIVKDKKNEEEKLNNRAAEQRADIYIASKSKYFDSYQLAQIRQKISFLDESRWNMIQTVQLKDPQTSLIISIFFGIYGVDRFYIGDTGIGIGKLLTFGGLFVWAIIDWFQIQTATRNKNFQKIQPFL